MALLNAGDRLAVLQLPGPSSGVVRCYIKCVSNRLGMGQHFELRLESTDECLAVARRRVKSATSSYVIGLAGSSCSSGSSTPSSHGHREGSSSPMAASLRRDDPEVVGKVSPDARAMMQLVHCQWMSLRVQISLLTLEALRPCVCLQLKANMMGTQYLLRGRGGNSSVHKGFNAQLLAVSYKPTINHMQAAPRTMTAILPVPESKVRLLFQLLCAATQPARSHTGRYIQCWVPPNAFHCLAAVAAHLLSTVLCEHLSDTC
jgi:hypothetical protein